MSLGESPPPRSPATERWIGAGIALGVNLVLWLLLAALTWKPYAQLIPWVVNGALLLALGLRRPQMAIGYVNAFVVPIIGAIGVGVAFFISCLAGGVVGAGLSGLGGSAATHIGTGVALIFGLTLFGFGIWGVTLACLAWARIGLESPPDSAPGEGTPGVGSLPVPTGEIIFLLGSWRAAEPGGVGEPDLPRITSIQFLDDGSFLANQEAQPISGSFTASDSILNLSITKSADERMPVGASCAGKYTLDGGRLNCLLSIATSDGRLLPTRVVLARG